jgi:hypothetical protein
VKGQKTVLVGLVFIIQMLIASLFSTDASAQPSKQEMKELVRRYFPGAPIMVRVAECESGLRHTTKSGALVRSARNAVGLMQLHEPAHKRTALSKGIDIETLSGNLEWARRIYLKEGLRPWNPSRSCWGRA